MSVQSTPLKPLSVLETCLYVDDIDYAKRFYREVLGLELYSEDPERHLFFRHSGGMLLLFNPEATNRECSFLPPHGTEPNGHIAFAADESDIPNWRAKLTAHNVKIEKEHTWSNDKVSLYFRDPAGNSLEITSASIWA